MKFKLIFSLLMGAGAFTAFAQGGYQDGIDYFNADRFEDARIILDKTLNEAGTDKALSYFYLGSIDLKDGKTDAAKANFDKGVQANPACGYNYIGLGQIALKAGNKADAQKLFKEGLNTDKKNAKLMTAVARAYYNVDPVAYAKEIEKYIKDAFKASKNLESAVYVLQGDMNTDDPGKAASLYEQAINYDSEKGIINPEAYVKYANVYIAVNPTFAIDKLKELNEKLPTSALAQRELAEKYYENNQLTLAAQEYGKYMSNPNHFQRDEQRYSGLLYFSGDYNKSLEIANKVLAADPGNPYMQRMVMLNKAALKDYDGALAAAQKLFGTPNTELTFNDYSTYGDILTAKEDYNEALKMYEQAYKMRPEKKETLTKLSSVYTFLENYPKAVETQLEYVNTAGDDVSLNDIFVLSNRYKNLAISAGQDTPECKAAAAEGLKYIDKALAEAAEQSRPALLRNRATLIMLRDGTEGANDELANTYEQMIQIYDKDPANKEKYKDAYTSAYGNLASYYLAKGDRASARTYYEKMLELNPDNTELRDYLKNFK